MAITLSIVLASCGGAITEQAPVPTDAATLDGGKALYEARCASCHGVDLRGTDSGPSYLSQVYAPGHHADAAFLLAVRQGVRQHHWNFGDMPPIDGLSDDDIAVITAYVRSVQDEQGFEP